MKRRVSIMLALAVIFLISNCSDKTIAKNQFPAQPSKKNYSAKSSGPSNTTLIKDLVKNQSAK